MLKGDYGNHEFQKEIPETIPKFDIIDLEPHQCAAPCPGRELC